MSALLAHAKALHAIASGLQCEAELAAKADTANIARMLTHFSRAYTIAADALGDQARAECSGDAGSTVPETSGRPRGRRG